MTYIISVYTDEQNATIYSTPVPSEDEAYLERVCTTLTPLSDEDYLNGPAAILQTGARYSYILAEENILWCIEWSPGLIVLRFSPNDRFKWTAIRSPVPEFGGREALPSDIDNYDEDAHNPQYNLIFDPWDAQFDKEVRDWKKFQVSDNETCNKFQAALSRVNKLQQWVEHLQNDPSWVERCKSNLTSWTGEGIRLN